MSEQLWIRNPKLRHERSETTPLNEAIWGTCALVYHMTSFYQAMSAQKIYENYQEYRKSYPETPYVSLKEIRNQLVILQSAEFIFEV